MYAAGNDGSINSLIVIRNGKIAAEKYFNGRDVNSYQTVRSVSKSFLSAMIGIAIDKGYLRLTDKLMDYFPEFKSLVTDSRVNNITLENLLTMRSGIKGDEEIYSVFTNSTNWIETILKQQLKFEPGTSRLYTTAGTHLISGILSKVTHMSSYEFAKKYLIDPLGIVIKDWSRDPQGIYFGGNEMFFTTRNIAVLGLLYMNKGKLNDQQIVPEEWVNKSLLYHSIFNSSWGSLSNGGYGYLWWLGQVAGQKVFFALGHGGQYIVCIPNLNMIIAATSNPYYNWTEADIHERTVLQIISDYIIPSAEI
jgi:CubicO group peptidase (beta-lactamase class C family)